MPAKNIPQTLKKAASRAVFGLLALLPFALGAAAAIGQFGSYGRYRTFSIALYLAFFLFLILISSKKDSGLSDRTAVVLLFVLTVLVRQFAIIFFNTLPVSDYGDAISSAAELTQGPVKSLYSARFPYWGFYSITLSRLFRIFGASISTAKTINVIAAGLTAVGIYLAGKKLFRSGKYGLAAALIFAFSPASILYANLPSGEHLFVMLMPVVLMLYLTVFENTDQDAYKRGAFSLLAGILLGLMDMYKPVAVILLAGFALSLVISEGDAENGVTSEDIRKKKVFFHALFTAILVVGFISTKAACFSIVERQFGHPPNRFGLGWTLRIGLDMEKGGRVNTPIQSYMNDLYRDYDEDYRYVNSLLAQEALDMLAGRTAGELLTFFREKFVYMWGSSGGFYDWIAYNQMETGLMAYDAERLGLLVKPLADAFVIISSILSALGALYCTLRRRDKGALSIGLFILGFTLMLFATEVQQRYRSVAASALPFFTAFGLIAVVKSAEYIKTLIPEIQNPFKKKK